MVKLKIMVVFVVLFFQTAVSQDLRIGITGGGLFLTNSGFYSNPIESIDPYDMSKMLQREIWIFGTNGAGFRNELNFGFFVKTNCISDKFSFTARINYVRFLSKGLLYWPPPGSAVMIFNNDVETKADFYTFNIGVEYYFFRSHFSPYLFTEVNLNKMSEITLDDLHHSTIFDRKFPAKIFWGLGAGVGIEVKLIKKIGLDISVKYCAAVFSQQEKYSMKYFVFNCGILYTLI